MAVQVIDNFKYAGKKPNFERDQFATVAAMKAYPESSLDEGHVAYCVETGKAYRYKSSNTNDATTGKWREDTGVTKLPGNIVNIKKDSGQEVFESVFGTTNVATLTEMFKGFVTDVNGIILSSDFVNNPPTLYLNYLYRGNIYKIIFEVVDGELTSVCSYTRMSTYVSNSLSSTEVEVALSANKGRILNEKCIKLQEGVEANEKKLTEHSDNMISKYVINAPVAGWKEMTVEKLIPSFGAAKDFMMAVIATEKLIIQERGSHTVDVDYENEIIYGNKFCTVTLHQPLDGTSGLVIAQLKLLILVDDSGNIEWTDDNADIEYSTNMSLFEQYPIEFLENILMYGVERNRTVSFPVYTRIGNMNLHRSLPIHNKMRGCLLDDSGNVVKYLNRHDWTDEVRDGSMGQVMIELPECYCKFEEDGNIYRVKLSEYPLPGYKKWNKCYVSAYEAALNRTENKLSSVVNLSEEYRGGNNNNNAEWDSTYRSLLGRPVSLVNINNFRTYARNRKPDSFEWNMLTYDIWKRIIWLYVVEYANNNIQLSFNDSLTAEGFKQGGLGNGVTLLNYNSFISFNSGQPFMPCGYSDSLGNRTGIAPRAMPNEYGQALTVYVARYRGIENIFGHLTKFVDGIMFSASKDAENEETLITKVYTCDDPELFTDTDYKDTYKNIVVYPQNLGSGFISDIMFGENGDIIAKTIGGSSSTYFPDIYYPPTVTGDFNLVVGGEVYLLGNAGLFAQNTKSNRSQYSYTGTRLCFIPKNK